MKLHLTRQSSVCMGIVALSTRIVFTLWFDNPLLWNASWLCVPCGALLSLPAIWLISLASRKPAGGKNVFWMLWAAVQALCLTLDAAFSLDLLGGIARHAVLPLASKALLVLITAAVAASLALFNGRSLGATAKIWLYALPILLVLFLLTQWRSLRAAYLTPIFGPGVRRLLDGSVEVAGWMLFIPALYFVADEDAKYKARAPWVRIWGISALVSMVFLLLVNCNIPAQINGNGMRLMRLEILLTGSDVSNTTQLPLLVMLFFSAMHLAAFDLFLGAALLERVLPGLDGKACVLITVVVAALIAMLGYADRSAVQMVALGQFIVLGAALALFLPLAALGRRKEEHSCP